MAKPKNIEVRGHAQEKEWLLRLGNGDIVEGAQNMIREMIAEQHARQGHKDRGGKSRK